MDGPAKLKAILPLVGKDLSEVPGACRGADSCRRLDDQASVYENCTAICLSDACIGAGSSNAAPASSESISAILKGPSRKDAG